MIIDKLYKVLKKNNFTFSTCESMTCGSIASLIGSYSGISEVYYGGFVTYMTKSKIEILNIDPVIIDRYTVVSADVARKMSQSCLDITNTNYSISITGYAESENNSSEFYISISSKIRTKIFYCTNEGNRIENIKYASELAIFLLYNFILEENDGN